MADKVGKPFCHTYFFHSQPLEQLASLAASPGTTSSCTLETIAHVQRNKEATTGIASPRSEQSKVQVYRIYVLPFAYYIRPAWHL